MRKPPPPPNSLPLPPTTHDPVSHAYLNPHLLPALKPHAWIDLKMKSTKHLQSSTSLPANCSITANYYAIPPTKATGPSPPPMNSVALPKGSGAASEAQKAVDYIMARTAQVDRMAAE